MPTIVLQLCRICHNMQLLWIFCQWRYPWRRFLTCSILERWLYKYTCFMTTDYRSIGCDSKPIKIIDHGGVCIQSAWIPKTLAHLNCKGRDNRDTTIGYANAIQCVLNIFAWHVCGRLARPTTANWEGLGPSKHTLRNDVGMFIYRFTSPQSGLCKYTNLKTTDYRSIGCDSKPIKIIDHGGVCIQSAWIPKTIVHFNCKGRYNKDTTIGYANAIQCVLNIFAWHVCGRLARPTTANWKGPGPSKHTLGHKIDMCINMIHLRFVKQHFC